jgi:hypothetical protein
VKPLHAPDAVQELATYLDQSGVPIYPPRLIRTDEIADAIRANYPVALMAAEAAGIPTHDTAILAAHKYRYTLATDLTAILRQHRQGPLDPTDDDLFMQAIADACGRRVPTDAPYIEYAALEFMEVAQAHGHSRSTALVVALWSAK